MRNLLSLRRGSCQAENALRLPCLEALARRQLTHTRSLDECPAVNRFLEVEAMPPLSAEQTLCKQVVAFASRKEFRQIRSEAARRGIPVSQLLRSWYLPHVAKLPDPPQIPS